MSSHSETPSTAADYHVRLLPEDAAVSLEALGKYAQDASDDGRGEDARRAFAAAGAIGKDMDEAMLNGRSDG